MQFPRFARDDGVGSWCRQFPRFARDDGVGAKKIERRGMQTFCQ